MPWQKAPVIDFRSETRYRWPAWNVGYRQEDLSKVLHERFNTVPIFLQDFNAFHSDVREIATAADGKADFEARLAKRKEERLEEMLRTFDRKVEGVLRYDGTKDRYFWDVMDLRRFGSFDKLIQLLDTLSTPEKDHKPAEDEPLPSLLYQSAEHQATPASRVSDGPTTPERHASPAVSDGAISDKPLDDVARDVTRPIEAAIAPPPRADHAQEMKLGGTGDNEVKTPTSEKRKRDESSESSDGGETAGSTEDEETRKRHCHANSSGYVEHLLHHGKRQYDTVSRQEQIRG